MADRKLVQTRDAYGKALLETRQGERQGRGARRRSVPVYQEQRIWRGVPRRFFDMGISEQDLISTSAGLAASGFIPFANSFAMFLTGRAYDQVRLQLCYVPLNVTLAGSSAGLTQGPDGASHQSFRRYQPDARGCPT